MLNLYKNTDLARLRSVAFVVLAALFSIPFLLFLPLLVLPLRYSLPVLQGFIRMHSWLLRVICGLSYVVSGRENLPDQPCMFASQHQSSWETVFFHIIFNNPAMIAKTELFDLFVIGRVMKKIGHIAIDRKGSIEATINSLRKARQRFQQGRSILIFPAGTRGFPTQQNAKTGVLALYKLMECPVIPITLNSGLFVSDKTLLFKSGVIQVNILPMIAPGLNNVEFLSKLKKSLSEGPV